MPTHKHQGQVIIVWIPGSVGSTRGTSTLPARLDDDDYVTTPLRIVPIDKFPLDSIRPWGCTELAGRPCINDSIVFQDITDDKIDHFIHVYVLILLIYIIPIEVNLSIGLRLDDVLDPILF